MDTPNWALVANGSMARLLELDPAAATHWTERQCLMHPAARLHGSAAGHEPPGHSIAGRSGLAPRSEAAAQERRTFAREVAHALREAVGAAERSRVAVFASNPFLGELMEQLDGATHQRLVASHAQDLTHLSLQELARYLQAERGG